MPEEHQYRANSGQPHAARAVDGLRSPQPWQATHHTQPHHGAPAHHNPPQHHQAQQHHQPPAPQPPGGQQAAHHQVHPASPDQPMLQPLPVVKMWSTRGLEYAMMVVSLWITAVALAWILIDLVNANNSFNFLVGPTSALVISVPVLTFFFIRLKRAEIRNPLLRTDPSRRRWTQLTQFLAFLFILASLMGLAYVVLSHYGTNTSGYRSVTKMALDSVVVIAISGLILIYYWLDEHRPIKR